MLLGMEDSTERARTCALRYPPLASSPLSGYLGIADENYSEERVCCTGETQLHLSKNGAREGEVCECASELDRRLEEQKSIERSRVDSITTEVMAASMNKVSYGTAKAM